MLWLQTLWCLHSVPPDALWGFGTFVCLCVSQKFLHVPIRYLSYAVGVLPYFSPHYILYIICVDSGDAWSGRCLIECVIYAKEVTPNLFQHAGNPQHTNAQIKTDLHIHTDVLCLRFSLYCIHRITHSDRMSEKKNLGRFQKHSFLNMARVKAVNWEHVYGVGQWWDMMVSFETHWALFWKLYRLTLRSHIFQCKWWDLKPLLTLAETLPFKELEWLAQTHLILFIFGLWEESSHRPGHPRCSWGRPWTSGPLPPPSKGGDHWSVPPSQHQPFF